MVVQFFHSPDILLYKWLSDVVAQRKWTLIGGLIQASEIQNINICKVNKMYLWNIDAPCGNKVQ